MYCDFEVQQRLQVLEALCGLRRHAHVERACVRIQARARGAHLRLEKHQCFAALARLQRGVARWLARARFARLRRACVRVQAAARGQRTRASPLGRAVARVCEQREAVEHLEGLTMRLARLVDARR